MYLLVCYDIVQNRRRRRLAKALEGLFTRVQYSVFEGPCDDERLRRLERAIKKHMDPNEDSVRIYPLCKRCSGVVEVHGRGPLLSDPSEDILY